jgi:hypothetical protein
MPYKDAREVDLLSAAQNGDQHAFVELCRRHSPSPPRRRRRRPSGHPDSRVHPSGRIPREMQLSDLDHDNRNEQFVDAPAQAEEPS